MRKELSLAILLISFNLSNYSYGNTESENEKSKNNQQADQKVKFKIGALVQGDVISQVNEEEGSFLFEDQQDFRRARLIAKLDVWQTHLRVDYDFGISEGWRNVFLRWQGDNKEIKLGQHTPPFSMENLNASKSHVFLERSIANNLTPGLSLGLSYSKWGDNWSATYGVFDRSIREVQDNDTTGIRGVSRFTYAPYNAKNLAAHLGFSYQLKLIEEEETTRVRARVGSRLISERLVDTGSLRDIDNKQTAGLEAGLNSRHFRLQGEYINTVLLDNDQGIRLNGGYVELATIFGTGKYRYSGKRGAIRPVFSKRGHGFELAVRAAELDLTDSAVNGGKQNEINYAFSWVINRNYRLSINYSQIDLSPDSAGNNQRIDVTGLRLQYNL